MSRTIPPWRSRAASSLSGRYDSGNYSFTDQATGQQVTVDDTSGSALNYPSTAPGPSIVQTRAGSIATSVPTISTMPLSLHGGRIDSGNRIPRPREPLVLRQGQSGTDIPTDGSPPPPVNDGSLVDDGSSAAPSRVPLIIAGLLGLATALGAAALAVSLTRRR
jgi:hypothetical protein